MQIDLSRTEKTFLSTIGAFAVTSILGICVTELFARKIGAYTSLIRKVGLPVSVALGAGAGVTALMRSGKTEEKIIKFTSSYERPSKRRPRTQLQSSTQSSSSSCTSSDSTDSESESTPSPEFAVALRKHVLIGKTLKGKVPSPELSAFLDAHSDSLESRLTDLDGLITEHVGPGGKPDKPSREFYEGIVEKSVAEAGESLTGSTLRALYHVALQEEGTIDIVKELLDLGLRVHSSYSFVEPPILAAIRADRTDVVKELLRRKASAAPTSKEYLDSPIVLAAGLGNPEIVKLLLAERPDTTENKQFLKKALAVAQDRARGYKVTPEDLKPRQKSAEAASQRSVNLRDDDLTKEQLVRFAQTRDLLDAAINKPARSKRPARGLQRRPPLPQKRSGLLPPRRWGAASAALISQVAVQLNRPD